MQRLCCTQARFLSGVFLIHHFISFNIWYMRKQHDYEMLSSIVLLNNAAHLIRTISLINFDLSFVKYPSHKPFSDGYAHFLMFGMRLHIRTLLFLRQCLPARSPVPQSQHCHIIKLRRALNKVIDLRPDM